MKRHLPKILIPIAVALVIIGMGTGFLYKSGLRFIIKDGEKSLTNYTKYEQKLDAIEDSLCIQLIDADGHKETQSLADLGIALVPHGYNWDSLTINLDEITYTTDEDLLSAVLEKVNNDRDFGSIGVLTETENDIVIENARPSTMVDIKALTPDIASWISSLEGLKPETLSLELSDYPARVVLTEEDQKTQETYQKYQDFNISYTSGSSLTAKDLYQKGIIGLVDDEIKPLLSEAECIDAIQGLLGKMLYGYNTVGTTFDFVTHDGRAIQVDSQTYGDYVDYHGEAEYIYSLLDSMTGESNRTPVMKQTAKYALDDTYIEVDIEAQHAYYFRNQQLLWDSDVVTGLPNAVRSTHTGIFFIFNKISDTHLQKWNVDVERWMSVTYDGQGFHDASWRSEFGGSIYKHNGSHGCINTPRDNMFELYDLVELDTPVVIY